jgi:hypothetical protein
LTIPRGNAQIAKIPFEGKVVDYKVEIVVLYTKGKKAR